MSHVNNQVSRMGCSCSRSKRSEMGKIPGIYVLLSTATWLQKVASGCGKIKCVGAQRSQNLDSEKVGIGLIFMRKHAPAVSILIPKT